MPLRLPTETLKAFLAFKLWCEMGAERSLSKAAGQLKKSVPVLARWSLKHRWSERALEWDTENEQIYRDAERKEREKEAAKWAKRRVEMARHDWDSAEKLQKIAEEMCKAPLFETTVNDADGRQITIMPVRWSLGDLPKILQLISDLKRRACEMPKEITEQKVTVEAPMKVDRLTIEQLRNLAELLEQVEAPAIDIPIQIQIPETAGNGNGEHSSGN